MGDEPVGVLPGTTSTGTATTMKKNTTTTAQVDGTKSKATAPSSTPTAMVATSMTVIILDSAQKKFPIPCNPDWTVGTFKQISSTILMPMMVWFLCCIRAFEFRRLIREAEEEATERIQNVYHNSNTTADDNDAAGNIGGSNSTNNTHDDDDDNSIVEIV